MSLETTENTRGTVEIDGKQVNVNYENKAGELPKTVNANYHDPATQSGINVNINVESGKVNFSASNVTAVTTISATIQAIKVYLEELIATIKAQ